MHIDLASLNPLEIYAAMTQTIVPRPVAWILTENENASFNLAPVTASFTLPTRRWRRP